MLPEIHQKRLLRLLNQKPSLEEAEIKKLNHHKKKASVLKENISNLNSKSDDIEKEANKCIEYLKDFEFHIKEMKKIQENQNKKYEKIQIEIGNIIKDVAINKRIKPSKIKSELLKTYEGTWLTSLIEDI